MLALVGCYAPHPQPGSPCVDGQCPAGLMCAEATQTCELEASMIDAFVTPIDTPMRDGCVPVPEICGNGIDEDCDFVDPPCAANDTASGAIDVSAGGTFTGDLAAAHDDAPEAGCNSDGGRDLFYKIALAAPEVIYFDTFGSNFGTILRVYPGKDCTQLANTPTCDANACGGKQSQLALSLPTGTSCIVIDQHATDTTGALTLRVKRGGRDGTLLDPGAHTYTGTSCSGANVTQPSCTVGDSKTSEDAAYYFTACPAQTRHVDATTCTDSTMTHYDTVMYLRPLGGGTIACNDDNMNCLPRVERPSKADGSVLSNAAATGPNLFWLTVDGYGGACGGYRLDTTLN